MIARHLLAAIAFAAAGALAAAGCGERVLLGGDNPPPNPVCAGAPCGTMCTIDPCPGANPPCLAPSIVGACDGAGTCVPIDKGGPSCPQPVDPCLDQPCGTACGPCDPLNPTCVDPSGAPTPLFACDGMGHCVPGPLGCPGFDPCANVPCGMPCLPPCDPAMTPGCVVWPANLVCDASGACVDISMVVCAPPPPWEPCVGKVCGDPCTLCPPTDPNCMEPPGAKACDVTGACVPDPVMCPP